MTKAVNELRLEWSPLRSHLAAGWTSVFSLGAIKPMLVPLLPRSSYELDFVAHPPTRLVLQLLSHLLTALKKKDMSTCLLWMSLWAHISARPLLSDGRRGRAIHPSRAEPHLHLLDVPTRQLDKRHQRCTLWLCSRPRCSPVRKPVWMQLHSATWGAGQTWLYTPPKPPPKPLGVRYPAWLLERHLWLMMTEMKEADKVSFLYAPVSSGSLFGPSVEGMLNASRRLRSHLRRCKTSSLSAPALLLLPVAPGLRQISRQLNQRQPSPSIAIGSHFMEYSINQSTCSYNCVIEIGFSWRGKESFSHTASNSTQYSFPYLREPRLR